jgi:hypothetical protein
VRTPYLFFKEESSLRKLAISAVTGVVFLVVAAVALALTNNTVNYSSTLAQKGKATKKGTNTGYEGILDVGTSDNKQPNVAPLTEIFFARQIKNNAPKFKSCNVADFSGKTSVPKKCEAAQVGDGHATAYVGTAGQPESPGGKQDLDVKAFNGKKGKQILLVLTGGALGSVQQVIPGTIKPAGKPFGYKVNFGVPKALQGQVQTAQIALTHFDVTIFSNKTAKVVKKVKGRKKGKVFHVTYLQVTGCPAAGTLPTRARVHFNNDDNSSGGQVVTNDGTMACH